MRLELFIANKLQSSRTDKASRSAVSTLNVAVVGMILAIVIMVVSVAVVTGFKQTIISKIGNLDSHIKVYNHPYEFDETPRSSISFSEELEKIISPKTDKRIRSANLIGEIPCVLKSPNGFAGLRFKGVPDNYDLSFLSSCLTAGKSDIRSHGVLISQSTADKLNIRTGERIDIYFMNEQKIKMRRCTVNGIFNTDFDDYDAYVMVGNLEVLQSVNRWPENTASYIEVKCNSMDDIDLVCSHLIDEIDKEAADYTSTLSGIFQISTIRDNNPTHFAWLDLLNTNIVVILILMMCVACFSIIACLIIVVLNKISTIGILKALGATNRNIRHIFIIIVMKIIVRAMVVGNGIALLLLLLQRHFHLIELDAKSYFMHYVPVKIGYWIVPLNLGILIVSFLALLVPSFIIASIKPAKTIRFE